MFRWLSTKYPKIVVPVLESAINPAEEEKLLNLCEPNPNGIEYDNLYLDMNGIIHPCCHPENKVRALFRICFFILKIYLMKEGAGN